MPPVILSVFSGTESLGTKSGSTEVRSSGGALSAPTLGISFAIVELVLVMWGPSGFDFCDSLQSAAPSLEWGFGKVRGIEVEMGLEALGKSGRAERKACLKIGILGGSAGSITTRVKRQIKCRGRCRSKDDINAAKA